MAPIEGSTMPKHLRLHVYIRRERAVRERETEGGGEVAATKVTFSEHPLSFVLYLPHPLSLPSSGPHKIGLMAVLTA